MQTELEKPIKSTEEICEAIETILRNNQVKKGTKRARTIECSFLQGVMWLDPEYMTRNPILVICLMSGRSLFDFNK